MLCKQFSKFNAKTSRELERPEVHKSSPCTSFHITPPHSPSPSPLHNQHFYYQEIEVIRTPETEANTFRTETKIITRTIFSLLVPHSCFIRCIIRCICSKWTRLQSSSAIIYTWNLRARSVCYGRLQHVHVVYHKRIATLNSYHLDTFIYRRDACLSYR